MGGIIWNLGHVMPTTSSHAEIEMVAKVGSGLDVCHRSLSVDPVDDTFGLMLEVSC